MPRQIKYDLEELPELHDKLDEVGHAEGRRRGDRKMGAASIAREILIWYYQQDPTLREYLIRKYLERPQDK